jgi:ABC-type Fe3+ transport system permease subunit
MNLSLLLIIILVILLAGLVMSYFAYKLKKEEYNRTGKYPRGHYMGQGLAIGIAIGIPIALALNNIFYGYMIGLVLGTFLGSHYEKKHESELRPLTPKERELRKKMVLIFGALFILGILMFVAMVHFNL